MNKSDLEKLTKAELIDLLLAKPKSVPVSGVRQPIPTPSKSVKQMVQD